MRGRSREDVAKVDRGAYAGEQGSGRCGEALGVTFRAEVERSLSLYNGEMEGRSIGTNILVL